MDSVTVAEISKLSFVYLATLCCLIVISHVCQLGSKSGCWRSSCWCLCPLHWLHSPFTTVLVVIPTEMQVLYVALGKKYDMVRKLYLSSWSSISESSAKPGNVIAILVCVGLCTFFVHTATWNTSTEPTPWTGSILKNMKALTALVSSLSNVGSCALHFPFPSSFSKTVTRVVQ